MDPRRQEPCGQARRALLTATLRFSTAIAGAAVSAQLTNGRSLQRSGEPLKRSTFLLHQSPSLRLKLKNGACARSQGISL